MYIATNQPYNSINPFTQETAIAAVQRLEVAQINGVSKVKLRAIHVFSSIISVLTQPVILISISAVLLTASVLLLPLSPLTFLIASLVTIIAATVLTFAIINLVNGNLEALSKHYAARAQLASMVLKAYELINYVLN